MFQIRKNRTMDDEIRMTVEEALQKAIGNVPEIEYARKASEILDEIKTGIDMRLDELEAEEEEDL